MHERSADAHACDVNNAFQGGGLHKVVVFAINKTHRMQEENETCQKRIVRDIHREGMRWYYYEEDVCGMVIPT